jgi:hypothetical protein
LAKEQGKADAPEVIAALGLLAAWKKSSDMILVFEAGRPQGGKRGLLDLDGFEERGAGRKAGRLRKAMQDVTDKWFGGAESQPVAVHRETPPAEAERQRAKPSKLINW